MRKGMSHSFAQVPNVGIPRSSFDRSFQHKTTFDEGYLIPIMCDEALPGDTMVCRMSAFMRMSTPIYPIMDNIYLDTFFFAVPIRLIHDNFKKMMGEQDNPADSIDYLLPTMTPSTGLGYPEGELNDYFGIPTQVPGLEVNTLFHRAYNLIWNQWFRDQNIQDSVVVDKDDGPDLETDYVLLKRNKRHDYFTSALPWPIKGGVEIDLPLGTSAPVLGIGVPDATAMSTTSVNHIQSDGSVVTSGSKYFANQANLNMFFDATPASTSNPPNIYADLSGATAATINQLREAFQLQRMLEKDARGGTRYNELVLSHFRVTIPDYRIQRAEYLGGGSSPININPVVRTNAAPGSGLGDVAAYATSAINGHGFTKSFVEHSVILCLANVRADLTYQQGLPRMFSRSTRYDFYWPSLSGLGEQAILNKEIYAVGTGGATDDDVFGYIPRWDEYRYKSSQITGAFRSNAAAPLDSWHLAQEFASLPALNSAFITENPPLDRVLATPTDPHFVFDSYFNLRCARPMPMFGVPGLVDHF